MDGDWNTDICVTLPSSSSLSSVSCACSSANGQFAAVAPTGFSPNDLSQQAAARDEESGGGALATVVVVLILLSAAATACLWFAKKRQERHKHIQRRISQHNTTVAKKRSRSNFSAGATKAVELMQVSLDESEGQPSAQ
jgi:uncharacterized protein HemX